MPDPADPFDGVVSDALTRAFGGETEIRLHLTDDRIAALKAKLAYPAAEAELSHRLFQDVAKVADAKGRRIKFVEFPQILDGSGKPLRYPREIEFFAKP